MIKKFELYYKSKKDQKQRENKKSLMSGKEDFRILASARRLYQESTTVSDNYMFPEPDTFAKFCLERVKKGDILAILLFTKPESKQNLAEDSQFEFIKESLGSMVNEVILLNKSGRKSKFIISGGVSNSRGGSSIKSLDLEITYKFGGKECKLYGTMKYTGSRGGSQDNQYNDVLATNAEFSKLGDPNIYTLSVLDGVYYTKAKYDNINSKYGSLHNKAVSSDQVKDFVRTSIIDWLQNTFSEDIIKKEIERINSL